MALCMSVGVILASFMMRKYGRKPLLILSNVPWLLGWSCIFLATEDDLRMMIVGFLLSGLSTGIYAIVSNVYVTETCAPRERNIISAIVSSCVSFGILLSHFLGMVFFWRVAIGCSIFIPGIAFMLAFFPTEMPTWFLLKGRIK